MENVKFLFLLMRHLPVMYYIYDNLFLIYYMLFNVHGKETCTHGTGISSAFASTQMLELWSKCLFISGFTCTKI